MQRKAISLVFSLLLAFMGVARADVVTIGAGSSSNVYIPTRSYYNYSLTQQLYTADEIGTAGTINSIAFFNTGTQVTRNLTLYMVNTDKTVFSDNYDWITVSASEQVFSGSVTLTSGAWATITLDTPFVYDGTSSLAVVVDDNTGSYVNGSDFLADNTTPSQALYIYSDGVNYDPFNPSNYRGTQPFMKNQIQLGFNGGGSTEDQLHVKYMANGAEVVDMLDLGVRPLGCWTQPFEFTMYSEGPTYTVTVLDFTPSDGMFTVEGVEMPFQVVRNADVDMVMGINADQAGLIERQFVAITEGDRAAHIWPVTVDVYSPAIPDVVEMPCEDATTFPFVEVPATAHATTLHNDYHIPPTDIEDGVDAVYKLVFDHDVMLSAEVSQGENGKVALYTEDFYGQAGPMVDNAYTGAMSVTPSQGGELTVFDGTVTNGYVPVEGNFADYYQKCEYVMPAGNLTEMTGMDIQSMTFFISSPASQLWTSTWTVFMKEVGATTINDFQGNSGATLVYQGTLDGTQEEMTVNFSTPYHYNGGNLLIGFYSLVPTMPYSSAYFYGEAVTGACVRGRNSSSLDGVTPSQQNFVPKTTFVYGNRTDSPMTPTPSIATGNATIEGMTVTPGTYYLVASSTSDDFEVTINREALPCPVAISGDARTPIDGATGLEPDAVELTWQLGEYTTAWRLVFGSTYYPQEGHPQTIITDWSTEPASSYTVRNLWNNTQYFWRIEEKNDNCPEGTASETWGFTTHLNVPHNLTVNDDQIFEGETVTLNWNAIQDRTYRQYRIYKDGQLIGSTPVNQAVTTYTVPASELTYNMGGYVFNVTAVYDEGESAFSNDVVVKVSGYSNNTGVNGYVWEQDGITGIGGAHVTITGTDEFGDEHVYNATTGANGYYNVRVHVGHYTNAVATLDGYQETTTVHELPFDVALNGQEDDVNFFMDENFDPVCSVFAQYYPDSLDPESPYVKVYWGCGFTPDAIIEDFETGDFSMFDWQLDGAYPWSITTNQPYEGQYCMKSGGAGVQNVTSDMSVTVDIPANGKMSFFGKISSEQNWDYGYFYIDGQQMGAYTGLSGWGEKQFNITEGTHTFRWSYQKDGSVNANDDCFYVDYVNFYFQPEPAQPGWVFYDDGSYIDAIGTTSGAPFYWAVMFPAGQYAGNTVSKVSMYDANAFTGQVQIYQGGTTAPQGSALYTQDVTTTGSGDFVEFNLTTPVAIDPAQNLWIVMYFQNGAAPYVASACANTGDPNGRFISLDGAAWDDVAALGLDYTWMLRAYVADGAKGEMLTVGNNANYSLASAKAVAPVHVKGEAPKNVFAASGNAMKHEVGVPERNGATRSLHHYNIYRTHCYNDGPYTAENTVLLATNWPGDTIYIDVEWADLEPGIYKWGVGCVYAGNRDGLNELAEPRESETIWSNCLEKGMYLGEDMVDINVLLNSADSPEGVNVSFTNLDENEQAEHPTDDIVLDETGFYSWESFRKGDYIVNITLDGYYPIVDTVSIWEETHMRYVMTEIIYGVADLYVSRTGWAMWNPNGEPSNNGDEGRHLEYYKVMCESLDHEPIFNANTVHPFCQVATDQLVEGEYYLCKVAAVYSTGMSDWTECLWQYESCENYAGTVNGIEVDGTTISWEYPTGGVTPPVPPVPGDVAEIVLNVPSDIWGDGSGYQMLLDADATMYAQLAAVNYFDEMGSFDGFEYTIPEDADYGINPVHIVINNSVTIEVPAGTYDYAIINPDKVSTIWFAGAGNVESKGDDMVYESGKRYNYAISASGTGDAVNLTVTDRNGRTYQPAFQHVATGQAVRHSDNIVSNRDGEWHYYDNGNNMDAIGLSYGTMNFSWGIMFPAGSLSDGNLTKVGYYDYTAHTGNIHIYQGGNGNTTPGTEVYTQPYAVNGTETYIEIAMNEPVAIDATQDLWVVMESTTPGYTASIDDSGATHANGALVSTDGVSYSPVDVASGGAIVGNWNLRAYIEEGSGPVPQPGEGNVLGAMIFGDGEWEAFVPYPTNSYVYEGDAHNVCVRMVYDGTDILPDGNYYYAMSCEECEPFLTCESDIMIHGEALPITDQAKIWWGMQPIDAWLTYVPQQITPMGALSLGDENGTAIPFYAGYMYPASMLAEYAGSVIDQVAYLDLGDPEGAGNLELHVFLGGDYAPETLITTQTFTVTGAELGLQTISLNEPVAITGTQNLWVMFFNDASANAAPVPFIEGLDEPNSRWIGVMDNWMDMASLGYSFSFVQMIHLGNGAKGAYLTISDGQPVEHSGMRSDFVVNVAEVAPTTISTDGLRYESTPVQYNIYRSADNVDYELIASLPYVESQTYYEFIDTPETSADYYYQVRTVYEDGCLSAPALNADDETLNYVLVAVNVGMDENDSQVSLFPNPTNGNVTIQAEGMSHITVVSILGQVVYDTDLNADEITLNMTQFNAGMYMVRISTENGMVVKRVTVMQ